MPDFSIKIVPVSGGSVGFQPDIPGMKPGDPLYAPPSSLISWSNETSNPQQVAFDDGSYTSNNILPGFTSSVDYVAPSTVGTLTYGSTQQKGEKGTIVIQNVVPMPPIGVVLLALALTGLAAPLVRAQTPPANGSQIPCLAPEQPLVKIPEIISSAGRLRATVVTETQQVRMTTRYADPTKNPPAKSPVQPGDPASMQVCFPEWVRTFRSPNTTTPFPQPVNGLGNLLPGPTLRARVGDFIELTLVNQIDPTKFGQSIDQDTCDTTSAGYPGQAGDKFPDCFHGSTTVNMHFHGTHTNPTTTGDNVFLEILSSKRLVGGPPAPPPPNFDAFFTQCEAELSKGSHVEWPVTWADLPKTYTDMQKELLQRFDKQPNGGSPLWPINQAAIDRHLWPQYYIGSFPYCYRLPRFPDTSAPPTSTNGAGSAEMAAHHGMSAAAMLEQGGTLKMGQSPGTHWYHAHKHGSTTIDVSNGFVGALIIEGQYDDEINQVYKAYGPEWTRTQPLMVINQFGTSPNLKGSGTAGQDKGPDFSVNGQTNPVISMKPGEVQMWRILNASGRAGAQFLAPPPGLSWKLLARDGVQFYTDNYTNSANQSFLLASGNRVDLLVQAECANQAGCTYPVLIENTVDPQDLVSTTGKSVFPISFVTVKVAGTPVKMPFPNASPAANFPTDLGDITDEEVKGTQTIEFGSTGPTFDNKGVGPPHHPAAVHTINGKLFDGEVGVSVLLNKVEEWTVTNNATNISHPFHIHINPFQVTEVFAPNTTLPPTTPIPPPQPGVPSPVPSQPATPVYVFDDSPLQPGQCRVNPQDPTTWKPCMATAPATHRIWWDVFSIPSGHAVPLSSSVCTELDKCPVAIQHFTSCSTASGSPVCTVTVPGHFKMRSRFVDYPGWFVIHCHILAHEDRGMMTVVEVTPLLPPYSHH
jgi:FtsP/CotA-like multicopper oxidase with cupredoxin domain